MPVQTKIQLRRDTSSNWTSTNPVLAAGEMGLETDSLKIKIGNGVSTWSLLSYASVPVDVWTGFDGGTATTTQFDLTLDIGDATNG